MSCFVNCTKESIPRPGMVLFDYGDTLARESAPDFPRGWRAVFKYVRAKPEDVGPKEAYELADSLWRRFSDSRSLSAARKGGWEIHEWQQLRAVSEALGLEFSVPLPEVETVLMDSSCESHPCRGTAGMLDFLQRQGIITGVISNIGWSGMALAHRLDGLFPENHFEFILASSEYGVRKPDPLLFQIALRKAGLPPERVWYCGDSFIFDVRGAHSAGIFPVWLNRGGDEPEEADFPYLEVSGWKELMDILGPSGLTIRNYTPADCRSLLGLFYDTVHTVNAQDYSKEQLDAWADGRPDMEKWERSLKEHFTLVAELDGKIVGFGDIAPDGYLDRLYVHRDFQGMGIATALCDRLEAGFSRVTTYASITARPFFMKRGYRALRENIVERGGVKLKNHLMEKLK